MDEYLSQTPQATQARYIRSRRRLLVTLNNGVELTVPTDLIEGLKGATPADLSAIEITPLGTGLHWPNLDADVSVEGLMQGIFGSRKWMAQQMGRTGGSSRSVAKATAARENGKKGGRPRKTA
ncbi:DUF2442 domain-containing protein [Nguyenibacter vanlangensis]|nr:DUF2442 domain-containing protein [Nguyenibacter vanlangensis]